MRSTTINLQTNPHSTSFFVFPAAGEEDQGDAHEVLGDDVDAGIDPDVILVGMGQAALERKKRRPLPERRAGPELPSLLRCCRS